MLKTLVGNASQSQAPIEVGKGNRGKISGKRAHCQRSSAPCPVCRHAAQRVPATKMDLLRELQVDMMSPWTALEQVPIRARLFHHLRMHRVPPCVLILPVVVIRHGPCKEWLFAWVSFRAGIRGRGAGVFVEGERERQSCDGGVKAALVRKVAVSRSVPHIGHRFTRAKEMSYPEAFVVRFWMGCMMGRLISAGGRSMDGVGPAAVSTLWKMISGASQAGFGLRAYADGLGDGLVVGLSDGTGGIWRFGVCVTTPMKAIWTLREAQSTPSRLQHRDRAPRLSMPS